MAKWVKVSQADFDRLSEMWRWYVRTHGQEPLELSGRAPREDPDNRVWFRAKANNSAVGNAPAYGVVKIVDTVLADDGLPYLAFEKPDADNLTGCALVRHNEIENGKYGQVTYEPWWALYNNAETPAYDEEWGTEANTWKLKQGNTGFRVLGATDTTKGRVLVERKVSSSGSSRWVEFTLTSSMATTDASSSGATVNNYWGGDNPGATVTVWNKSASSNYIFSGTTGAKGYAVYDERAAKWRIVQMECS